MAKPLIEVKHVGKDFWSRETFIDQKGRFFCDVSCNDFIKGEPFNNELYYVGTDPDEDPQFPVRNLIIVDEFSQMEGV